MAKILRNSGAMSNKFKVEGMDVIANISLNIHSFAILTNHFSFICLFLYDASNVKKHICSSVSNHIDNSCIYKIRNQLGYF